MSNQSVTYYPRERYRSSRRQLSELALVLVTLMFGVLMLLNVILDGVITQWLLSKPGNNSGVTALMFFVQSLVSAAAIFGNYGKTLYMDERGVILRSALARYIPFVQGEWRLEWDDISSLKWSASGHYGHWPLKIQSAGKVRTLNLFGWVCNADEARLYDRASNRLGVLKKDSVGALVSELSVFKQLAELKYLPPLDQLGTEAGLSESIEFREHPWFTASLIVSALLFVFFLTGRVITDDIYITDPQAGTLWGVVFLISALLFLLLHYKKTPVAFNSCAVLVFSISLFCATKPLFLMVNSASAEEVIWQTKVRPDFQIEVLNDAEVGVLDLGLMHGAEVLINQKVDLPVKRGWLNFYQVDQAIYRAAYRKPN